MKASKQEVRLRKNHVKDHKKKSVSPNLRTNMDT